MAMDRKAGQARRRPPIGLEFRCRPAAPGEIPDEAVAGTQAERIALIRKGPYFDYPAASRARWRAIAAIAAGDQPGNLPPRLVLAGPADNGRSTVASALAADMEQHDLGRAAIIRMPARITPDTIFAALRSAGTRPATAPDLGSPAARDAAAVASLRRAADDGLRLVIVDDADGLRDLEPRARRAALRALFGPCCDARAGTMLVGSAMLASAVLGERENIGHVEPVLLPRWEADADWRDLLARWDQAVPLRRRSDLAGHRLSGMLHDLSDGRLGALARILRAAATAAITTGSERIDEAALRDAAEATPAALAGMRP